MAQNLVVGGDTYEGVERVAATNTEGEVIVYPEGGDTASHAVQYVHQTLTDEEKAQARNNIDALGSDAIYFRHNAYTYNGQVEHINTVTINIKKVVDGEEVVESVELDTTTLYEHARLHGYEGELEEFYDSLAHNMQTLKGDGLELDPDENILYITSGEKRIGTGVGLPELVGGSGDSSKVTVEHFNDETGSGTVLTVFNTSGSTGETEHSIAKIYNGANGIHGTDCDVSIARTPYDDGWIVTVTKTIYQPNRAPITEMNMSVMYDAKTAYDSAKEGGYEGTEEDFVSLLAVNQSSEKGDGLEYDEETNELFLMSGDKRISEGISLAGAGGSSPGGGVSSWNDLTDRPFGDYPEAFFPEAELTVTNIGMGVPCVALTSSLVLEAGKEYLVTFNGEKFVCVAKEFSSTITDSETFVYSGVCLGNDPGSDDGEPFVLYRLDLESVYYLGYTVLIFPRDAETFTFSIGAVQKLDKKYLPDDIGGVSSWKDLTDKPFDARYCLRLEAHEAEADTNYVWPYDRPNLAYHRAGDVLPHREEVIGSVIEWSQIAAQQNYKTAVTESMISDTEWGTGFCINNEDIYSDSRYPGPVIIVLYEVTEAAAAKGFAPGVYFMKSRYGIMVNEWAWGGKQRIHKELLPVGYPHLRVMETVLPETVFDFSASTEAACDAVTLAKREWYLVTCDGLEYVVQAKTLIEGETAVGIVLGDLNSEPFAIKVLSAGTTTVLNKSGSSAVRLSVRRIIPTQMGEQFLPPKMVVKVTVTEELDDEGANIAWMDHTVQDIEDAYNAGYEVSCDLPVVFNGIVQFHVLLPLTEISKQAFFAGFAGANMLYTVSTVLQPDSAKAYVSKKYISGIDRTELLNAIEGVLK